MNLFIGCLSGRKKHYFGSNKSSAGTRHPEMGTIGTPRRNTCVWCGKPHPDRPLSLEVFEKWLVEYKKTEKFKDLGGTFSIGDFYTWAYDRPHCFKSAERHPTRYPKAFREWQRNIWRPFYTEHIVPDFKRYNIVSVSSGRMGIPLFFSVREE